MSSTAFSARSRWLLLALSATLSLTACGGDEEAAAGDGGNPPTNPPSGGNRAPTISGTPPTSMLYGRNYAFIPSAVDADGDTLTFSITGAPSWVTFDRVTGRLQGAPGQANIGTTASIVISVSDGRVTTSLPAFTVNVVGTATGSATLSWLPPTLNNDGTPLTNLASYRVYFGTSYDALSNMVAISSPGIATFVVDQLTPATWYFAVTAVNSGGTESGFSNVALKSVL